MATMADYDLSDIATAVRGGGGNGYGGFGNASELFLWFFLFAIMGGGWGRFGGQGGYQGGAGAAGGDVLYPWMEQQQTMSNGFSSLAQQLCNCCAQMQQAMSNGFFGIETSANNRQMANMNQLFGMQTATMQGFNTAQMQLAGLGSDIAREACADRQAVSDGVRDILAGQVAGTQAIMDKLCQLELDGYKNQLDQANREVSNLREEVTRLNFAASQANQNQLITQGFANEVDALYNRLNTCPVPTTPVYGRTPIFTCNNNGQCPCNN